MEENTTYRHKLFCYEEKRLVKLENSLSFTNANNNSVVTNNNDFEAFELDPGNCYNSSRSTEIMQEREINSYKQAKCPSNYKQSSESVKTVKNAETQVQLPELDVTKSVRHIETQVDEQDLPARAFSNRNFNNNIFRSRQQQEIEFLDPCDFETPSKMVILSDKFEYQIPEHVKDRIKKCIVTYDYKFSNVFRRLMRSLITDREAWLDNYNFSIIKKYPIIDACIDFMQGYYTDFTKKDAKKILSRMSSERRYTVKQMQLELQKQQSQVKREPGMQSFWLK